MNRPTASVYDYIVNDEILFGYLVQGFHRQPGASGGADLLREWFEGANPLYHISEREYPRVSFYREMFDCLVEQINFLELRQALLQRWDETHPEEATDDLIH